MANHKRSIHAGCWLMILALALGGVGRLPGRGRAETDQICWVIAGEEDTPAKERTWGSAREGQMTRQAEELQTEEGEWQSILVNEWNSLPEGFSVQLMEFGNGQAVDARIYGELQRMLAAARAEGLSPLVCSSFRTMERQRELFENRVQRCIREGVPVSQAEKEAAKWVARPGTSEHHTGLAVDIVALSYQLLDEGQERTPEQQWLMNNCWRYGFILRYPSGKSERTGIHYEPWHYRYVGREAAEEIMKRGICLEEYLEEKDQ